MENVTSITLDVILFGDKSLVSKLEAATLKFSGLDLDRRGCRSLKPVKPVEARRTDGEDDNDSEDDNDEEEVEEMGSRVSF